MGLAFGFSLTYLHCAISSPPALNSWTFSYSLFQHHYLDLVVATVSPYFWISLVFFPLFQADTGANWDKCLVQFWGWFWRGKGGPMKKATHTHERHRLLKELPESVLTTDIHRLLLKGLVESISEECFFLPKWEHSVHGTRVQADKISTGHRVQGTVMC